MENTNQKQPDNGTKPYRILPKTLAGKDFVFIIVTDKFLGYPDPVRLDAIDDFASDCNRDGLHGSVVVVWRRHDGSVGFYPEDVSEVRDFLRAIPYEEFVKLFSRTIRSAH